MISGRFSKLVTKVRDWFNPKQEQAHPAQAVSVPIPRRVPVVGVRVGRGPWKHRKNAQRARVRQRRQLAFKLAAMTTLYPPQCGHRRPEFSSAVPGRWSTKPASQQLAT